MARILPGGTCVPRRALGCAAALAFACLAPIGRAVVPDLRFTRIGNEAGIPGDVVTAVHRDTQGFLWIGTRNGLARYDGYSCVVYDHDPANPASLSDNQIRAIAEDRAGGLWIGTNTGGLDRLDRATGRFERFRHDAADPASLSHDSVYAIVESFDGSLWIGTQVGLNRRAPGSRSFERFMAGPAESGALSSDYVMALHEDRARRLWVATLGGGLNVRDPRTGRFTAFRHDAANPLSLAEDRALSVTTDEAGRTWVGTYVGVQVMDSWGAFRSQFRSTATGDAPSTFIASCMDSGAGRIWVGVLDGRVVEIDPRLERATSHPLAASPADAGRLRVLALEVDARGAMWVGTAGNGLFHARPADARFATVTSRIEGQAEPATAWVNAAVVDAHDTLWVGTMNQGLLRRDGGEGPFSTEAVDRGVTSLAVGRGDVLWIGTTEGLVRYEPATRTRRSYKHHDDDASSLGRGYVTALLEDADGTTWVGTGESGLCRLRADGSGFDRFGSVAGDTATLSDNYVTSLLVDSRGTLWVGTRSGGLNAFDRGAGVATRFRPGPEAGSLSHHSVTDIHEDRRARLWVATAGGGVNLLDASGRRFTTLRETDGLPDDDVMSLAEDADGSTWIATNRGIGRLSADGETVVRFGLQDGLPTLEMDVGAALATPHALYFGTPLGLVEAESGTPMPVPEPSPLAITAAPRQGGDDAPGAAPPSADGITLAYREWLSLEFAILDLSTERDHAYQYRLAGAGAPWIDLGRRHELTFVDLVPGDHLLELRGRNSRGAWTELATPVPIRVVPPFWMTSWFRALVAVLLLALGIAVHQVLTRALRRRNATLVKLQAERELALEEARRGEERLRVLAHSLEVAKEEERKHLARELHDELGQSLTAVKVNLQLAQRTVEGRDAAHRLDDGSRIIDQLIQKVRSLSLDLRPPLMEEQGLVPALRSWLGDQARRAGIDVEMAASAPTARVTQDIETAAFRTVQEAVTNALRHAEATQVRVSLSREGSWLVVAVDDDGRGFDADSVLGRAAKGGHVGILGIQERVRSLGGSVAFESSPGEGTTVRIRLPWRDAA